MELAGRPGERRAVLREPGRDLDVRLERREDRLGAVRPPGALGLSRYSQPLRRLPLGRSATLEALTDRLGRRGLTGLFSDPLGANSLSAAS